MKDKAEQNQKFFGARIKGFFFILLLVCVYFILKTVLLGSFGLGLFYLMDINTKDDTKIVRNNIINYVNDNYAKLEAYDYSDDTSSLAIEIQDYIRKGIKKPDKIIVKIDNRKDYVFFNCGDSTRWYGNSWYFIYAPDEVAYISSLLNEGYQLTDDGIYKFEQDRATRYEEEKIRDCFFYGRMIYSF